MSTNLRYRLGGLVFLAIGLAVGWFGIWMPLEAARAGTAEISWQLRAVVLVPLAIVFGLFLLVTGDRVPYRNVEKQTLTPVGWALMAVMAIGAFGAFFWMKMTLSSLGYQ